MTAHSVWRVLALCTLTLFAIPAAHAQSPPPWSIPTTKQFRVVIVSDAAVEADDPAAIAYALLSPSLTVHGIVATHYTVLPYGPKQDPTKTMEASYEVAGNVLNLLNRRGCVRLRRGSPVAFSDRRSPPFSEGADLIIEEAMRDDPRPLYVLVLGAATDMAAAYLKQPKIASRLTVVWIGGSAYPKGGPEYNQSGDVIAAGILMDSDLPLWQIPSPAYMRAGFSVAEAAARIGARGSLGRYLFQRLDRFLSVFPSARESWLYADLAAPAVLLEQSWMTEFEQRPAPSIEENGNYKENVRNRPIRIYRSYDHRLALEDLYAKMALLARTGTPLPCSPESAPLP